MLNVRYKIKCNDCYGYTCTEIDNLNILQLYTFCTYYLILLVSGTSIAVPVKSKCLIYLKEDRHVVRRRKKENISNVIRQMTYCVKNKKSYFKTNKMPRVVE